MSDLSSLPQRINVRGTSGSGKSTLAHDLSEMLRMPHIELDALFHMPGWTERPLVEFRTLVDEATRGDRWVIDGNYSKVRDIVESRMDTVVWLDYALPTILGQLTRRTFRRWYRRELLWGTNRESLWRHFFVPKDSLYWWVLTTYRRRREQADEMGERCGRTGVTFLRFHEPREAAAWLQELRLKVSGIS